MLAQREAPVTPHREIVRWKMSKAIFSISPWILGAILFLFFTTPVVLDICPNSYLFLLYVRIIRVFVRSMEVSLRVFVKLTLPLNPGVC